MFEVKGMDELQKMFSRMPDELESELESAVNEIGDVVLKKAQAKAKGSLKNGIELKRAKKNGGYISGQLSLKRGYGYGVPVELGHKLVAWGHKTDKHIKEQPYLRPAADESVDEAERIALAATDRILQRFSE